MAKKQSVLVCGQSLCMAGLVWSLRQDDEFAVVVVEKVQRDDGVFNLTKVVAVFYDTEELTLEMVAALAGAQPGVPLIGLNAENSVAKMVCCRQKRAESVADLKGMIRAETSITQ